MDALVMCGGTGSRLGVDVEKPLLPIRGRPMVAHVIDALVESRVDAVVGVGSPQTPATNAAWEELVDDAGADATRFVTAPGNGYVRDLQYALDSVALPVVTVSADLPLLYAAVIDRVLDAYESGSMTVAVPTALKRQLGASVDETVAEDGRFAPTGLNVVGPIDRANDPQSGGESIAVVAEPALAVNVNRRRDAWIAETLRR